MTEKLTILLVQLFSNGDCLYATTVAKQIKKDYPGCKLIWAIAGFCKSIIANNSYVDEIMEVNSVPKNDVAAFRKLKKDIKRRHDAGEFDLVFVTHNMDTNQALYDGCIRSGILNAYPNPITVPLQPVLDLYEKEKDTVKQFASAHQLQIYKHVILFEFAPQSGQSKITKQSAISISEQLATDNTIAIILSSGNKIDHAAKNIIDGSVLTLRETAALTHHCSLLLGCSSGITWISTSGAAKQLPMIQILNPDTTWVNPVSRDFERYGFDTSTLIEFTDVSENKIVACVKEAMSHFSHAKAIYNQQIPLQFKTSRKIVYNLLCYLEFGAIAKHIKVNRKVYGDRWSFYREVLTGIITAPFKLLINMFKKKILKLPQ